MTWFHTEYPYGGIGVFKDFYGISFSLNHVENMGAAWGMFADHSEVLFVLRCIVILALFAYTIFINREPQRKIPFLCILAGATGTVCDYVVYGHVIDIFHLNFWGYTFPLFNVADTLICTGVFLLFFQSFLKKKGKAPLRTA
jgi:signal peptidase II